MGGIGYFYDEKLSSKFCYSHYKAFKKSDFYKGTNSYKKKLEIRKDGEEHFKKLQKKN